MCLSLIFSEPLSEIPSDAITCTVQGVRKPAPECFTIASDSLQVAPEAMVLIDDRAANIEAAQSAGLQGLHFQKADQLSQALRDLGLDF